MRGGLSSLLPHRLIRRGRRSLVRAMRVRQPSLRRSIPMPGASNRSRTLRARASSHAHRTRVSECGAKGSGLCRREGPEGLRRPAAGADPRHDPRALYGLRAAEAARLPVRVRGYSSHSRAWSGVWIMNRDGSGQPRVVGLRRRDDCRRAARGRQRIAFASHDAARNAAIYVVGSDGKALRRLTAGEDPDWKPDVR